MLKFNPIITADNFNYPELIYEDGKSKKLARYEVRDGGVTPIYEDTEEVSESEALEILLGGAE